MEADIQVEERMRCNNCEGKPAPEDEENFENNDSAQCVWSLR